MRRRVAAVMIAFFTGCGARTGLDQGSPDASTAPDGTAQDAPHDREAAPPEAEAAVDAATSACEAALQSGSPTPMPGYCSTRANLSTTFAPTSPQIAWALPLPLQTPYEVIELVVDASGHIYATVDTAVSGWVLPDTLVAIDGNGALLWTQPYGDRVPAQLFLGADGDLRFRLNETPPVLAVVSSNGTLKNKFPLPDTQRHGFAVGRDGTLFTALWDTTTTTRVAHLAADGSVLWTSEPFERCGVATSPIVLGPDDLAMVGFSASCDPPNARLLAFRGSSGAFLWARDFPGLFVHNPAMGPDGHLRLAYAAGADQPVHLASVDTNVLNLYPGWDLELPGTGINVWDNPIVITPSGTAIVRTNGSITAVSATGEQVWTVDDDPMLPYGAFADPEGQVIVTTFSTVSHRTTTGDPFWSVQGLSGPAVMGPNRSVVGISYTPAGDVAIALARDP